MKVKKFSKVTTIIVSASFLLFLAGCSTSVNKEKKAETQQPNFLILMSDNHSWNHLGCYGDPVISTPVIDKLAENGIRFNQAYCSAPSCAPARASMLTGQDIWRLEEAANLWGDFPPHFKVFPELLDEAGYLIGHEGKGWGPGDYKASGRTKNPAGQRFGSFEEFYNEKEKGQPFFYWYSSRDPHRPYEKNKWGKSRIDKIEVPPYLPDNEEVRGDMADYYSEIENFDRDVSSYLQLLKEMGQLENTLILVCSDNGWQMPRGLANLYDFGTRIPMVISMPERYKGGRVIDDFVSLNDVAPTFLEIAGIDIPQEMNAKSLVKIFDSEQQGQVDETRDFIVTGRERHAFVRKNGAGYGGRSYRTKDFLYIRNYDPGNWPAGDPPLYGDVDAHMLHYPCPTKTFMLKNKEKEGVKDLFLLGFGKRPAEELYDLAQDPNQMNNVASSEKYKDIKEKLADNLTKHLVQFNDPRETGTEMKWLNAPYYADKDKIATPNEEARKELELDEEYPYVDELER